eukprot:3567026-Amphidinium_carterae.1
MGRRKKLRGGFHAILSPAAAERSCSSVAPVGSAGGVGGSGSAGSGSDGFSAAPAAARRRIDETVVRGVRRADPRAAAGIVISGRVDEALGCLVEDFHAPSSRSTRQSLQRTWTRYHSM